MCGLVIAKTIHRRRMRRQAATIQAGRCWTLGLLTCAQRPAQMTPELAGRRDCPAFLSHAGVGVASRTGSAAGTTRNDRLAG